MSKKTNTVQKRERLLKKLVVLNRYTSKNDLLEAVNKHFKQEPITLSALSGYINDCELKHTNDGYIIEDPKILSETINDLFASYKKKYYLRAEIPFIMATSSTDLPLYLVIIHCKASYEEIAYKRLKKFITPTACTIGKECLMYYFLNDADAKQAYDYINEN